MKLVLAAAVLLCPAFQETPAKPDPAAELKALRAAYQKAEQEYFRPMREAKTAEERNRIKLDPAKHPALTYIAKYRELAESAKGTETAAAALHEALQLEYRQAELEYYRAAREGKIRPGAGKHPARDYIPKAVDLAHSAAGTETGAQIHFWVVQIAGTAGLKDEAEDSIQILVTEYVKSPILERVATGLEYSQGMYGADFCREILVSIEENSPHPGAKAAALFVRGLHAMRKDAKDAKALLERVQKEFPQTPYARRAEGSLFEVNNLQVGLKAPDIEGTDANGKSVRISQFRGKVVVLDFWGFW